MQVSFPYSKSGLALGREKSQVVWNKARVLHPADVMGEVHKKMGRGSTCLFFHQEDMRSIVHSHPRVAAICPRTSVMCIPYPANTMDTLGVGRFRRILPQVGGKVQLGGILEACRSTLWWLVRMVEGSVNQGADCWEVIRI